MKIPLCFATLVALAVFAALLYFCVPVVSQLIAANLEGLTRLEQAKLRFATTLLCAAGAGFGGFCLYRQARKVKLHA